VKREDGGERAAAVAAGLAHGELVPTAATPGLQPQFSGVVPGLLAPPAQPAQQAALASAAAAMSAAALANPLHLAMGGLSQHAAAVQTLEAISGVLLRALQASASLVEQQHAQQPRQQEPRQATQQQGRLPDQPAYSLPLMPSPHHAAMQSQPQGQMPPELLAAVLQATGAPALPPPAEALNLFLQQGLQQGGMPPVQQPLVSKPLPVATAAAGPSPEVAAASLDKQPSSPRAVVAPLHTQHSHDSDQQEPMPAEEAAAPLA
jgi:hypothetical protein